MISAPTSVTRPVAGRERRLTELDAIRGLAALSVFWGHAFGMLPTLPRVLEATQHSPVHFFYDGAAAVLLFFVLSGFVLNLKYVKTGASSPGWVWDFVIRRAFRIYPAFVAAFCLALVFRTYVYRPDLMQVFSEWFTGFWKMPISWSQCAKCLTLIGPNLDFRPTDPPIWSLVLEMRISLFFPLVILLTNGARRPLWDGLLLAGLYTACFMLSAFAQTFQYLPHFFLGAMCAKYFKSLQPRITRLRFSTKLVVLLTAFLLYETGAIFEPMRQGWRMNFFVSQLVGVGAAGIILCGASFHSLSGLLNTSVGQFLGRTSYSFYLVHLPLLMAIGPLLQHATGSVIVTWAVCLAVAYAVSELLFKFIEAPGMKVGARTARAFAEGWAARARRAKGVAPRLQSPGGTANPADS